MRTTGSLARQVARWTRACDRTLRCLASYLHHRQDGALACYVGSWSRGLKLACLSDADFACDTEDPKSTSELCQAPVGSRTFIPIRRCRRNIMSCHTARNSIQCRRSPGCEPKRSQHRRSGRTLLLCQTLFGQRPHRRFTQQSSLQKVAFDKIGC